MADFLIDLLWVGLAVLGWLGLGLWAIRLARGGQLVGRARDEAIFRAHMRRLYRLRAKILDEIDEATR